MSRMKVLINAVDLAIIRALKITTIPLARFALFAIFFWFGALKLANASPASPLVADLLEKTLPFITFEQFVAFFGIYEMIIGITFLIPRLERFAIVLLIPHMITTFLPLFLLPGVTWQGPFLPTLEGQYIIKNLVIIALAFSVALHLHQKTENPK